MKRSLRFEDIHQLLEVNRAPLQRVFFVFVSVALLLNILFHISLFQIGGNPLIYQENDPTYWLFMALGIPSFAGQEFALLFDALLVISSLISIVFPKQHYSCIVFFTCYFIYFILYNMAAGHHYHIVGILFIGMPFMFRNGSRFAFFFVLMRFLFCFIMFSAALWKISRGNLSDTDHFYSFVVSYHAENLIAPSFYYIEPLIIWLLNHKTVLHTLWIILIALELSFIVGLFTLKADRFLLIAYILFFLGGWLLLGIYNYENIAFLLTLRPVLNLMSLKNDNIHTIHT